LSRPIDVLHHVFLLDFFVWSLFSFCSCVCLVVCYLWGKEEQSAQILLICLLTVTLKRRRFFGVSSG
jgi:hypothetical protein